MGKSAMCMKCGSTDVFWHENRNGKWVLCRKAEQYYENGIGQWIEPHYCAVEKEMSVEIMIEQYVQKVGIVFSKPTAKDWKELSAVETLNGQLKSLRKKLGEQTPSMPVEVFKGRKVAKGTVGEIIWFGVDGFGIIKIGIKDAEGNAHFTAITNVRFVETANA
jgi:hypothetical protein